MARRTKQSATTPPAGTSPAGSETAPADSTPLDSPSGICRIHWLDARCGILASAAEWLLAEGRPFDDGRTIDLSRFTVVVPGRSAGHRFVEILIDQAAARERRIVPPTTTTLGSLPEELYEPAKPLADSATETLCWVAALAAASPRDRGLIAPGDGRGGDAESDAVADGAAGELDAARMLVSMHRELASHLLSFATLATKAEEVLPGFGDHTRWQALARLEAAYLERIDRLGLWDRQTARRVAIERSEVDFVGRLVLLATVDVDPLQRRLLEGVRGRIDALVAVPEGIGPDPHACFDDFGCIVAEAWAGRPIPVPLERIAVVDDADAEAEEVVRWIRRLAPTHAADEITIAVPDPEAVPAIEQRLAAAGLAGRYAAGRTVERTSPWHLVAAIVAWLGRREFAALADLLRCPDCVALVRRRTGEALPAALADKVASRHLPWRIDRDHLAVAAARPDDRSENERFLRILDCVDAWLAPLVEAAEAVDAARRRARDSTDASRSTRRSRGAAKAETSSAPSLAASWAAALRRVCADAVDGLQIDRDAPATRVLYRSLAALGEELSEIETIPDSLAAAAGAAGLARLLLSTWGRAPIPPSPAPTAIDVVGWLEVALDDGPALAITGCVEGSLPGTSGRDPLLPEPLRQALGLDNASRTAVRDAWMLSVAAARERLLVVVPRRGADGSPRVPSRLLFRRAPDDVVRVARLLFSDPAPPAFDVRPATTATGLVVPPPTSLPAPVESAPLKMGVTEFRDYLACPYRYWLRHRLDLGRVADDALELGPADFGTLIHECLDRFGKHEPIAASSDADAIAGWLSRELDRVVEERFGTNAAPAVYVQAELARRRLQFFATVQAERTRDGWRIHATERFVRSDAFVVDGVPVTLSGKIDRIDHHPDRDRWEVLDYKTSATGRTPERTHRQGDAWVDLQLPLYRHLLVEVPGIPHLDLADPRRVGVGYFNIPSRREEIRIETAPWTEPDYASADEAARDVVRAVRAGRFWPRNDEKAAAFPELDAICQTHTIRDEDEGDDA